MRLLRFRGTRGLEPRVNPTRVKRVQHILSQATCDPRDTEGGGERGWKGRAAPNVDRRSADYMYLVFTTLGPASGDGGVRGRGPAVAL